MEALSLIEAELKIPVGHAGRLTSLHYSHPLTTNLSALATAMKDLELETSQTQNGSFTNPSEAETVSSGKISRNSSKKALEETLICTIYTPSRQGVGTRQPGSEGGQNHFFTKRANETPRKIQRQIVADYPRLEER